MPYCSFISEEARLDATSARASEAEQPEVLLSVQQAAQRAGVSRHTVRGWIVAGHLQTVLIDGRHALRPADLLAAQATAHVGTVLPIWREDPQRAGHRLRALREEGGLTQLALAAASGLTHEAISNLELGKRVPTATTVRQLARALGVLPERFIAGTLPGLTMLTLAEAASRLDIPHYRLQRWVRNGELPGRKISGRWRVPEIAVSELDRSGRLRGQSRRLDPRYRGW
jgi:excisionase family DNA binding protein